VEPELSADQRLLRDSCEAFLQAALPVSAVRAQIDAGAQVDPSYRSRAAELGSFAFLGPDELGGGGVSGEGLLDLAIIAELRGRHLQPGNFIDTNVAVATLSSEGAGEQQSKLLPSLVAGEAAIAWVGADQRTGRDGALGYAPAGTGFRLTGTTALVVEGQSADWLLVTAAGAAGPGQFVVPATAPGVTVRQLSAPAFKVFRDLAKQSDRVNETDLRGSREKLLEKLRLFEGKDSFTNNLPDAMGHHLG